MMATSRTEAAFGGFQTLSSPRLLRACFTIAVLRVVVFNVKCVEGNDGLFPATVRSVVSPNNYNGIIVEHPSHDSTHDGGKADFSAFVNIRKKGKRDTVFHNTHTGAKADTNSRDNIHKEGKPESAFFNTYSAATSFRDNNHKENKHDSVLHDIFTGSKADSSRDEIHFEVKPDSVLYSTYIGDKVEYSSRGNIDKDCKPVSPSRNNHDKGRGDSPTFIIHNGGNADPFSRDNTHNSGRSGLSRDNTNNEGKADASHDDNIHSKGRARSFSHDTDTEGKAGFSSHYKIYIEGKTDSRSQSTQENHKVESSLNDILNNGDAFFSRDNSYNEEESASSNEIHDKSKVDCSPGIIHGETPVVSLSHTRRRTAATHETPQTDHWFPDHEDGQKASQIPAENVILLETSFTPLYGDIMISTEQSGTAISMKSTTLETLPSALTLAQISPMLPKTVASADKIMATQTVSTEVVTSTPKGHDVGPDSSTIILDSLISSRKYTKTSLLSCDGSPFCDASSDSVVRTPTLKASPDCFNVPEITENEGPEERENKVHGRVNFLPSIPALPDANVGSDVLFAINTTPVITCPLRNDPRISQSSDSGIFAENLLSSGSGATSRSSPDVLLSSLFFPPAPVDTGSPYTPRSIVSKKFVEWELSPSEARCAQLKSRIPRCRPTFISGLSASNPSRNQTRLALSFLQNKRFSIHYSIPSEGVSNQICIGGRNFQIDLSEDSPFEILQLNVRPGPNCSVRVNASNKKISFLIVDSNTTTWVHPNCFMILNVFGPNGRLLEVLSLDFCSKPIYRYVSEASTLRLSVLPTFNVANSIVIFNFTSHALEPQINVVYQTLTSGYITSPMYVERNTYFLNINHNVTLPTPESDFVLIHFEYVELSSENCLSIHETGDETAGTKLLELCKSSRVPAKTFNTSVRIAVRLRRSGVHSFKLGFSFHKKGEIPPLLDSGLFDCSTQAFANAKQYLSCNFLTECENGEDETNCSFSSPNCKSGFYVGGKCLQYWQMANELTWNQAHIQCIAHGGSLIILNTLSELQAIDAILLRNNIRIKTFVGLKTGSFQRTEYRNILQWLDFRVSYDFYVTSALLFPSCVIVNFSDDVSHMVTGCDRSHTSDVICQFVPEANTTTITTKVNTLLPEVDPDATFDAFRGINVEKCPTNQMILDFVVCDPTEKCGFDRYASHCQSSRAGIIPMFACENGLETVSFTFVCDHQYDCQDKSDELFCMPLFCEGFICSNGQCVPRLVYCDGMADCLDRSDEDLYRCMSYAMSHQPINSLSQISLVNLTFRGFFSHEPWSASDPCPDTHFRCPQSHCLPVYLLCNNVIDCPQAEDEKDCDDFSCPGFYRCRHSMICLHPEHVCDNVYQCPLHDDEQYCGDQCPETCRCLGYAFVCKGAFETQEHKQLRYLDAESSGMALSDVSSNDQLVHLSLRNCQMREMQLVHLVNLRELDLSYNHLTFLSMGTFAGMRNLRILRLSFNPISQVTLSSGHPPMNSVLKQLHVSGLAQDAFFPHFLADYPGIEVLNLSHGQFESVGAFTDLPNLEVLDMTSSPVKDFPVDVFKGLLHLKLIYTDNYKLCCDKILPAYLHKHECHAPVDEISSCDNLLRNNVYKVFLWLLSLIAIAGNGLAFIYRICRDKNLAKTGFGIFVTSLSLADFLMGVYLAIIGTADQVYLGTYSWSDTKWKQSFACKLAGFLSLVSSEVSALTILLITLDRFIVLRFPFSTHHFEKRSAAVMCAVVWTTGLTLAAVPLLPTTKHWEFYSQNGICLPLPITRKTFPGQTYAFSIMIILNFILFMLIAGGQVAIFSSIRSNSQVCSGSRSNKAYKTKARDLIIAKRLFLVVLSDFLCWFPIGLLGMLAETGFPISGEINVVVGIFVLPFNSALNPFLYTINTIVQRRREMAQQKLSTELELKIRTEILDGRHSREICQRAPNRVDLGRLLGMIEDDSFSQTELELICRKIKIKLSRQVRIDN